MGKLTMSAQKIGFWLPFVIGLPLSANAQIVPDGTLPANSVVVPRDNTFFIEGGTPAGANLFHSFDRFDVPTGSAAFFNNAVSIDNIISRITGGNISNIDGVLRANGTANLFLVNPNGIVFGPNARLDIGGSFIGTSADSVMFGDGSVFAATTPTETAPLLSVNVPVGLQFGSAPGNIVSQARDVAADGSLTGLQVNPGNTLALVGGEVTLDGGILTVPAGRAVFGGVGANETVSLAVDGSGFAFDYGGVETFSNVTIERAGLVDVSGAPSGEVDIRGQNISLLPGARILAFNFGSEVGGTLRLEASESVEVIGEGNYLQTVINLLNNNLGNRFTMPSGIFSINSEVGTSGDVEIETSHLNLESGAFVYIVSNGFGTGGNLTVDAVDLKVSASLLNSATAIGSSGNSGNLTLNVESLRVQEGGAVNVSTQGSGRGGILTVNASRIVELQGDEVLLGELANGDSFISPTGFFAATENTGDAGEMQIFTDRLLVTDGAALLATSTGTGRAGSVTVVANDIELVGTSPDFIEFPSSIQATGFNPFGTAGESGNVSVTVGNLTVRDGASLAVNNVAPGTGGRLEVSADSILLENEAVIEAETAFGSGGNVFLRSDNLILRNGSNLTVTAGSADNPVNPISPELREAILPRLENLPQDGGNLTIETENLVALENSDITANSASGFGGRIRITATGIFGTEFREMMTPESDITATSDLGAEFSGTVEFRSPDTDPGSDLVAIDEDATDVSNKITASCIGGENSFVVTGRGGLPPDPTQYFRGEVIWRDFQDFTDTGWEADADPDSDRQAYPLPQRDRLVEAANWVASADGSVQLVADPPSWAWYDPAECEDARSRQQREFN